MEIPGNCRMVQNKKFVCAKTFIGAIDQSNFKLVEETLGKLEDGEILCKGLFFSVDPYMRLMGKAVTVGSTMVGSQVCEIIESKHPDYSKGTKVVTQAGWTLYTKCRPEDLPCTLGFSSKQIELIPNYGNLPLSLALGVLGMPGNTAYFGFLEVCKPQPGEVVVVSGAAGAVGSHVGQIAKIKGCRVIGITGSQDKAKVLKEEFKFDAVINYKKDNIKDSLSKLAPNGIDCYFDNVGGQISSDVISQMNAFGRISVCGSISSYNDDLTNYEQCKASVIQPFMLTKQLKMEGIVSYRWSDRFHEGVQQNLKWIKEGKLIYKEDITEGFEKLPDALIGIMNGKNIGKAIVKV